MLWMVAIFVRFVHCVVHLYVFANIWFAGIFISLTFTYFASFHFIDSLRKHMISNVNSIRNPFSFYQAATEESMSFMERTWQSSIYGYTGTGRVVSTQPECTTFKMFAFVDDPN